MTMNASAPVGPPDTIPALVARWAADAPEHSAIGGIGAEHLTYGALATLMDARSRDLRGMGIEAGDRVAIAIPNGPLMATAFLAAASAGCAAPLNPGSTDREFASGIDDLGVRLLIVADDPAGERAATAAEDLGVAVARIHRDPSAAAGAFDFVAQATADLPARHTAPDDTALVLRTSGTTARPKVVPLTHRNLCTSAQNVAATLELTPSDTCLNVMPLFHIHGLVAALLASLSAGGSVVCTPGFSAASFLGWLRDEGATWYTAVPTMHHAIAARARTLDDAPHHQLRFIRSSSAALPPAMLTDLESAFGVPVIEAYGMTEAAHQMTSNPLPPGIRKPGSVGRPAGPDVSVVDGAGRHVDDGVAGEVVIRGPNVTAGYEGMDDRTAHFLQGGWFRTGDQGFRDEEGYLFLTGRIKEMINRGGETIAPREIDEALLDIDGVAQAVAFPVSDGVLGEEVAAVVTLQTPDALTPDEIVMAASERLSFAKVPKQVMIVDDIPKGPTGKLQRIGLADLLGIATVRSASEGSGGLTPIAATLMGLWREVLEIEEIDPDVGFLDLGGDSLAATALIVRVEDEFSIDVPLVAFSNAATVRQQADLLETILAG